MNKLLDRLEEFIIGSLMAVATIVIFISVVHRYLSGYEIPVLQDWLLDMNVGWAQEFCIILFVWMAKFGAAYGVRTGIHVGVDILVNKLSGTPRAALIQAGLVCGVIFTGLIGIFGALFVWENGMAYETLSLLGRDTSDFFEGPTTPDLEWPTWMVLGRAAGLLPDVLPLPAGDGELRPQRRVADARPRPCRRPGRGGRRKRAARRRVDLDRRRHRARQPWGRREASGPRQVRRTTS